MTTNQEPDDQLRRACLALQRARAQIEEMTRQKRGPIAIVGLGCRFPGGASGPEALWALLRDGTDVIGEVPADRWDLATWYDPDPKTRGRMSTRFGGFLDDIDGFDPGFFGIAPREAVAMDPRQRLLLEVAWEALEHGGQAPSRLAGTATGVFVGIAGSEYSHIFPPHERTGDIYLVTGNSSAIASGRLSYLLGLRGPCLAVDTACSSSLVAVHLACQSLRAAECDMAIAGGVNLILLPDVSVALSKAGLMSADGRCRAFDARASGFVRSEGCGVVVLKRLADAEVAGDRILAVIRGSAVNHDGRSNGLTAPSGPAQEEVIRKALAAAGVKPALVSYVEAHGTGTPLGDPIELQALGSVYGEGRPAQEPLTVGSIKTNLGHLEAAAGVAGLIKIVLALQHREIPAHLHFDRPNPHITWDRIPVVVPRARYPWPSGDGERIAAVSSFGFSGTNAHVIVQEGSAPAPRPPFVDRPLHVLALSARSDNALRDLVHRYRRHLREQNALDLRDLCHTANSGRSHFDHRIAFSAASLPELLSKLDEAADGSVPEAVVGVPAAGGERQRMAFLFSDQDSWDPSLARELNRTSPVFSAAFQRCDELVRPHLDASLLAALDSVASLPETVTGPSLLFAFQFSLTELWRSWGIEPAAVMGLGAGEHAAAFVAGVLNLEDSVALVAARGRSGVALRSAGHPAVDPPGDAFEERARSVVPHSAKLDWISCQSESRVATLDNGFWSRQLREPARVSTGIQSLLQLGYTAFLDLGPGSDLSDAGRHCGAPDGIRWFVSHRPRRPAWTQMIETLSALYCAGTDIDWAGFDRGYSRRKVSLPTYPFQRQRCWFESAAAGGSPALHPANPVTPEDVAVRVAAPPIPPRFSPDVSPAGPKDAVREIAGRHAAEVLRLDPGVPLDARADLVLLGLDSMMAAELKSRLDEAFGIALPLLEVAEARTVERLASAIGRRLPNPAPADRMPLRSTSGSPLVAIRATGSKSPFFCVHPHFGYISGLVSLARHLDPERPFYGLQAPGLEGECLPFDRVEELASHYVDAVRSCLPAGLYHLGGLSFGGVVAFEMACQLRARGHNVGSLVLMDTVLPYGGRPPDPDAAEREAVTDDQHVAGLCWTLSRVLGLPIDADLPHLTINDQLQRAIDLLKRTGFLADADPARTRHLLEVMSANTRACYRYRPKIYSGRLSFFRAAGGMQGAPLAPGYRREDSAADWARLTSLPLDLHEVPGDHALMLAEPHVRVFARRLASCLDQPALLPKP